MKHLYDEWTSVWCFCPMDPWCPMDPLCPLDPLNTIGHVHWIHSTSCPMDPMDIMFNGHDVQWTRKCPLDMSIGSIGHLNSINHKWSKNSGLKLSQIKTHCVMFTNRRNWSFRKTLKVNGAKIQVQKSKKFRGITYSELKTFVEWAYWKRVQEIQKHLDVM